MMTRDEFDKLSDDDKYQAYSRAQENYETLSGHGPFTPMKLQNNVRRILGRELNTDDRMLCVNIYGWCKKNGFMWKPDMKPMDVYSVACWTAKKIIANNQKNFIS